MTLMTMAPTPPFPYGELVHILTARPVEDPFSGEPVLDPFSGEPVPSSEETIGDPWTDPTVRIIDDPVMIVPSTSLDAPRPDDPEHVEEGITAYLPYGDPITRADRVEVRTGPHVGVYTVDGVPRHWKHPLTGWEAVTMVSLTQIGQEISP